MQERRQTAFTQQEVTEMQKEYLKRLTRMVDLSKDIRLRYINKVDVIMLLDTLVNLGCEEIDIIKKDIEAHE